MKFFEYWSVFRLRRKVNELERNIQIKEQVLVDFVRLIDSLKTRLERAENGRF